MADVMLNNLNKLLLQLVFQLQQASYSKEHLRQQIQIYAANTAGKKIEICQLREEINKNEEAIACLRKRNNSCRENCNAWKPTYMILSQHEEYLQKELQNHQESTEKDKKMYQDYTTQYQETFKQHQEKYLATAIAQEYHQEKNEFEEIQNRVLKQSELLKQKEAEVIELQEPGPFQSLSQWALQIASLRHNTKEIITHAVVLRQQSLELEKTAEELQKKINYFKQQIEKIEEDQHKPEVIEKENAKELEARKASDECFFSSFSLFKESHHVLKEKHQIYESLQLPSICQKLVQSFSTLKPLFQQTQRGMEERKDFPGHSAVTSVYFSHVENERQKCNDTIGTNIAKNAQLSSVTSLQNQTPLRLLSYQKQTNNRQWFEAEAAEIGGKKVEYMEQEEGNRTEDSAQAFQWSEVLTSRQQLTVHFAEREDDAESFPRTPEPNILPKTPASSRMETPMELTPSKGEGSMSKSPGFPFLSSFTAKSLGFNFFDSSVLGAETSPSQLGERDSAGNLNPISSHKEGKKTEYVEQEEASRSKDSAHVFQDEQATTDCHFAEREDDAVSFPRTPESNILPKTPASSRMETPLELTPSKSEGSVSKSPGFPFLSSFTAKSFGFNFFDSSVLGAETSPGQLGESYSGNLNPISSHKDIGNLFGKMENDDSFAFSFPSCSSAQAFQNGKDDFSFPFAFGSSQAASLKGFQSSSQSRKSFSLF
ncbi:protein SIX6OS1 [Lacerta agilis]|uniref:protein SIX6OS1 n=1 Tax=Lacerta agilis TaxID=80427 RepID=UPI001419B037|nr:protein SIX6OS1 [Lacerta agilis]